MHFYLDQFILYEEDQNMYNLLGEPCEQGDNALTKFIIIERSGNVAFPGT